MKLLRISHSSVNSSLLMIKKSHLVYVIFDTTMKQCMSSLFVENM